VLTYHATSGKKTACGNTYHSSRHSAATLAITAGAELYSVSKILGHGSMVSTQVYASVNMEKKAEAVNWANGIFG